MKVTVFIEDSNGEIVGVSHFENESTGDNVVVTLLALGQYNITRVDPATEMKYVTLKMK